MGSPYLGLAGYAAAALAFAGLAILLALRQRGEQVGSMLLAAIVGQAAWAATMSGVAAGQGAAMALAPLLEAARSLLWILFLIQLASPRPTTANGVGAGAAPPASISDDEPVMRASRRGLVIAVVLATTSAGSELIAAGPGMVFAARTLNAVFGLVCLEQVYRNAAEGRRWAAKYLALALLALFSFDLVMYSDAMLFSRLNEAWWIVRGYANLLLVPLLAVSAARNPQWKLDVGVSRQAVFHSAALTLAGAYLILVSVGGYYVRWFGGEWGAVAQALIVFAALLGLAMAAVSGTVRARLRVFVAKHFFSYRFDYRNEWLRLTRLLASGGPQDLPVRAIEGLGQPVESRSGAVWLESDGSYRFEAGIAWRGERAPIPAGSPLVELLRDHEWIVDLDELRGAAARKTKTRSRGQAARQDGLVLPETIAAHEDGWLIVPLLLERELIGFVLLDRPLAKQVFDWETRDLLKAAARQIASHIGVQRALEKLITAQQFESFNRMSAFVVHDLKNLVAQLGLMTKNAQRHRDNPEFQDDMLATVENVMNRMQGLLLQLRAGTRPVEHPAAIRLLDVLHAAVQSRRGLRPEPAIHVDGEFDDDPDATTMAHRDRLERVIGHLLQNAAEACDADGRVELRLRRDGGLALIEVEDNGRGMSETFIRDRLFAPFQSTKAHGMGIGAFESREYLREIGGSLEVSSTEGAGTVFRIRLPLAIGVRGT